MECSGGKIAISGETNKKYIGTGKKFTRFTAVFFDPLRKKYTDNRERHSIDNSRG
jgi:hypothetical protein